MHVFELFLLAIIQGVTELFPVSSLAHSILVPAVFHWSIDRDALWFLPYIVVLHLGTAFALLIYFWRDWSELIGGFILDLGRPRSRESRLLWLLIIATIPAGVLGILLQHVVRTFFAGFVIAGVFLMLNGVLLILGDRLKGRSGRPLDDLRWPQAFAIGCAQAFALIPGISRSGVTLLCGLGVGQDYAGAARFSFLLGTPIILAAGVVELPKLLKLHAMQGVPLGPIFLAGLLSGVAAYISTAFLMRYFNNHEVTALRPFGIYCILAGAGSLIWLGLFS